VPGVGQICSLICGLWINYIAVSCPVDIIFVLDESGSVRSANFDLMKAFVSQLVGTLDVSSTGTRIGLITYASYVDTGADQQFNLIDHSTVLAVQDAIAKLVYSSGGTNTAVALDYVAANMLTSAAGDRADVPNVVIVLTDGYSGGSPEVCTS